MVTTVVQNLDKTQRAASRDRFFLVMSMVLLAILMVAFTDRLYLRPMFGKPPLPMHQVVHGVVLSLWFLLYFTQATLVAVGRLDVHRRVGVAGAALAVLVVATGMAAMLGVVPGMIARGEDIEDKMPLFAGVFWGNGGILVAFVVLVTTAIALRRHPAAHKRLMLLASIGLMPPATHRVGLLPFLQVLDSREANAMVFALVGLLTLLLTPVVYDLLSRRRLHPATAWGVSGFLVWFLACIFVFPATPLGRMSAEWLVRIATN